jgi:hypothetical protein
MSLTKLNYTGRYQHLKGIKIPSYPSLKHQELIRDNRFTVDIDTLHSNDKNSLDIYTNTIPTNIIWTPTDDVVPNPLDMPIQEQSLPPSSSSPSSSVSDNVKHVNPLGFIILRNIINSITNEYWKECYRCIRRLYPDNRILIIDDNSKKQFVSNELLTNTMIIESEFPKRGEFLPYYYYLRTNFCEKVVILHDSMFIKKYINFNSVVDDYRILIHFGKEFINDRESFPSQINMLRALNSDKLNNFYNKKDQNYWSGCFGSMSVITYKYLKQIDDEFHISRLIPVITCRIDRCAFERILGCMLQFKNKTSSLLGHLTLNCDWRLNFNTYKNNSYNSNLPIIKIFTGR